MQTELWCLEVGKSLNENPGNGMGASDLRDQDFLLDYVEEDQGVKELQGLHTLHSEDWPELIILVVENNDFLND